MRFHQIIEGKTKIVVPKVLNTKGPGKKGGVFYNPVMEFNRDVSVMVLNALNKKNILDGLAGTGIRGVRIANEVGENVVINDVNPKAYKIIKKNVEINNLDNAFAENKNLNTLLSENRYGYIDIDPFGSPAHFIDSAMRGVKKDGVLGITATDTATLCGVYPKTCLRRYSAAPLKTGYAKETGIRILIGFCVREGLKYDLGFKPLLVHSTEHYFRIYLQVEKGVKKADRCTKNMGYVLHNFKTGERKICKEADKKYSIAGPLWTGKLFDKTFLNKLHVKDYFGTKKRIKKMLGLWKDEANSSALYYEVNNIAKMMKTSPLPMIKILKLLSCSRTHFSPTAFKTDADIGEIKSIFSK
jgi:tRNA (guanine26-N2/guanine27-N2)-dimethyltransferase